ncbi:MAG TPA: nitroreductase/quinone reductase family protein [Herpetosiphonaceae bacterium]
MEPATELQPYADEDFCYLTTVGRVSGRPHEIEMWFALGGTTLYMLAGYRDRADWVKNIRQQPSVQVRIRERMFVGRGRIVDETSDEAIQARLLVGPKYNEWQPGQPRSGWTWEALPVAVDLDVT